MKLNVTKGPAGWLATCEPCGVALAHGHWQDEMHYAFPSWQSAMDRVHQHYRELHWTPEVQP